MTIQSLSEELKEARAAHNVTKGELVRTQSELEAEAEERRVQQAKVKELQAHPGLQGWIAKGAARAKSGIPRPQGVPKGSPPPVAVREAAPPAKHTPREELVEEAAAVKGEETVWKKMSAGAHKAP